MATVNKTPDIGRATGLRENGANTAARDTGIGMRRYPANEVDCPDPNGLRGRFGQEKGEWQSPHRFSSPNIASFSARRSYKFNDPEAIRKWVNPTPSTRAKVGNDGKVRITDSKAGRYDISSPAGDGAKTRQNASKHANEPRSPAPIALNRKPSGGNHPVLANQTYFRTWPRSRRCEWATPAMSQGPPLSFRDKLCRHENFQH